MTSLRKPEMGRGNIRKQNGKTENGNSGKVFVFQVISLSILAPKERNCWKTNSKQQIINN